MGFPPMHFRIIKSIGETPMPPIFKVLFITL